MKNASISGMWKRMPFLVCIFLVFYCWNLYWGGTRYKTFFESDSNGYYSYLPATFIYQDFRFGFIDDVQQKYFLTQPGFDFRQKNEIVDKWFCGTALAIAPFFLISHALSILTNTDANGYTFWYAWGLNIAGIFYCLIGLLALQKILKKFFTSESVIGFVLFLLLFATNLLYYATTEPAMSHIYSFAFINLFLLATIQLLETGKLRYLLTTSFFMAMVILIRPVNVLIVLILPFLAGSMNRLKETFQLVLKKKMILLTSLFIFCAVLFIQLVYYYLQSGSWLAYTYGGEKMDLFNPHLIDFLFSYKKGLFVWIPLSFLSLSGFIFLYRQNRFRFFSLAIFLMLVWYVLSSWWNWWYGGSFGTRPMVEYLFVIAFLLCYALENLRSYGKKIFITLCVMCFVLCQVQTFQYRHYFIHWEKMDKESYWKVFMRVDLILKKENPNEDLLK